MALPFLTINQGKEIYDKAEATKQRADSLVNGSSSSSTSSTVVLDWAQLEIIEVPGEVDNYYYVSPESLDIEDLYNKVCTCAPIIMLNFYKIHDTISLVPATYWYMIYPIKPKVDDESNLTYFTLWADDSVYLNLRKIQLSPTEEPQYILDFGFNGQ